MPGLTRSPERRVFTPRFWGLVGAGLVLAVVIAANGHFLYVAIDSQSDCAKKISVPLQDGGIQVLQPAKAGC